MVVNDAFVTTRSQTHITTFMRRARVLVAVATLVLVTKPARADDVADEISKLRGLSIDKKIEREVVDEKTLRAKLLAHLDAAMTADDLASEELGLERWGLLSAGTDLRAMLIDQLTERVAGFYDPDDKKLYLAGKQTDDGVLSHEIVHALEDQHFGLAKVTKVRADEGDRALARESLIEGDGTVAMLELQLQREGVPPPWGQPDAVALLASSIASGAGDAPLVVRDLLSFPYVAGMQFVASIRATGSWKDVDAVFKNPPESTEQILHPDHYPDDDPVAVTAKKVPLCLDGWKAAHQTVWGEAGWSVLLRQAGVDADRAAIAAAGWGGDRVVTYARDTAAGPRDAVGVGLTTWDATVDAIEFESAAIDAVDGLVAGTIVERASGRTVWLGADLRVSLVERRDDQVLVVIGAPLSAKSTIADDVWKAWKVGT
jgi:hypothetical protein